MAGCDRRTRAGGLCRRATRGVYCAGPAPIGRRGCAAADRARADDQPAVRGGVDGAGAGTGQRRQGAGDRDRFGVRDGHLVHADRCAGPPLGDNIYAVERLETLAEQAGPLCMGWATGLTCVWATAQQVGRRKRRLRQSSCRQPPAMCRARCGSSWPRVGAWCCRWDRTRQPGAVAAAQGRRRMQVEKLGGVRFVPLISPLLDDPANWAEACM